MGLTDSDTFESSPSASDFRSSPIQPPHVEVDGQDNDSDYSIQAFKVLQEKLTGGNLKISLAFRDVASQLLQPAASRIGREILLKNIPPNEQITYVKRRSQAILDATQNIVDAMRAVMMVENSVVQNSNGAHVAEIEVRNDGIQYSSVSSNVESAVLRHLMPEFVIEPIRSLGIPKLDQDALIQRTISVLHRAIHKNTGRSKSDQDSQEVQQKRQKKVS